MEYITRVPSLSTIGSPACHIDLQIVESALILTFSGAFCAALYIITTFLSHLRNLMRPDKFLTCFPLFLLENSFLSPTLWVGFFCFSTTSFIWQVPSSYLVWSAPVHWCGFCSVKIHTHLSFHWPSNMVMIVLHKNDSELIPNYHTLSESLQPTSFLWMKDLTASVMAILSCQLDYNCN